MFSSAFVGVCACVRACVRARALFVKNIKRISIKVCGTNGERTNCLNLDEN